MKSFRKNLISLAAGAGLVLGAAQAQAVPVDAELLLLMDVSGSVNSTEFDLQKNGYVSAFQNAAVHAALASTTNGVAVQLVQWSGAAEQFVSVGWTHLYDAASSNAFAAAIAGMSRAYSGTTGLGEAVNAGIAMFGDETGGAANGFESLRQVIDVSGDGADNTGALSTSQGRDAALFAGVDVINGIAILGESGLLTHYQTQLVGGTNANGSPAFVLTASGFADFENAITQKLQAEVTGTGVPEPGMVAIMGLGIAAIGFARRRKTA